MLQALIDCYVSMHYLGCLSEVKVLCVANALLMSFFVPFTVHSTIPSQNQFLVTGSNAIFERDQTKW